jgi:hypothetical protein
MIGSIGLTSQLPKQTYTTEQKLWLSENSLRSVRQSAPEINVKGVAAAKPIAFGAQESHITADMNVRYKDKNGATVTAYDLRFIAAYVIANPDGQQATTIEMVFPFPQTAAVLSEVTFMVDGVEPSGVTYSMQGIQWKATLDAGQARQVEVRYRADGVGSFGYSVPSAQRIKDLDLRVTIRGANEIRLPEAALEPTARQDTPQETTLAWRYLNTITNRNIQVELPARPKLAFAQRVERLGQFFMQLALAAPVLTALFLLCWLALMRLEARRVAVEHTVLLGMGFFLFYPLFIFSAGLLELPLAFILSVVVAGALVVGFGVRVLGGRFVAAYLVPLLIVFYGLLTRGLTEPRTLGVTLVSSAVILLALFMWRVSRRKPQAANVAEPEPPAAPAPVEERAPEPHPAAPEPIQDEQPPVPHAERYCVHCGQRTANDFRFCPQCGKGAQATHTCVQCGLEYIPAGDLPSFCPACGNSLVVK